MRATWNYARGFAFVEALIVAIVLGILAAIVVPQFSNTGSDTRRTALANHVHTVRTQIESYTAQHDGKLPDLISNWTTLPTVPKNPLRGNESTVKNGIAIGSDDSAAFVYDYGQDGDGTGRFWGVDRDSDGVLYLIGD